MMRKNKRLFIFACAAVLLTACRTPEEETQTHDFAEETAIETDFSHRLIQADSCAEEKRWEEAYKLYSELQRDADDPAACRAIQLKTANALFMLGRHSAALAALAPMPELPGSLHDAKKLALASRILQKMNGKPEHVEALLEIALDNSFEGTEADLFRANGYAELGRVYFANSKNARAAKCFEYASDLFRSLDDKEQAETCRHIAEYLK